MTAHDTIVDAIAGTFGSPRSGGVFERDAARNVMAAVRGMAHDELAELRPDIATEFYILREQAAMRGQYLLTTLRAHHAHQAEEDQP